MKINETRVSDIVRTMTKAEKNFALAFYRWALRDGQREFAQGFPFLRRIKSVTVADYLEFVADLSPRETRIFRVAMVKRFNRPGCYLAGDSISKRETELIERYLNRNMRQLGPGVSVRLLSPAQASRFQELEKGSKKFRIDREELRGLLRRKLKSVLGERTESLKTQTWWRHFTPVGKWTVITAVDTGKRFSQMSYSQTVSVRLHVDLVEHMSILGWLGIAGQTNWDLISEADITRTVKLVAELSSHFINAISRIERALSRV